MLVFHHIHNAIILQLEIGGRLMGVDAIAIAEETEVVHVQPEALGAGIEESFELGRGLDLYKDV